MKLGSVIVSLLFYFVAIQNEGCNGCLEKERIALLKIRDYILSIGQEENNEYSELESWVDDRSSNCCTWNRVKCSNNNNNISNGHITHLSLGNLLFTGEFGCDLYTLELVETHSMINGSLFHPFEELINLNLSCNGFQITKGLPRMMKLETLDLSYNGMNGLFSTLGIQQLLMLKVLDLTNNKFSGSIEGLCKTKNLIELSLSSNKFSGIIPKCLSNLRNLKVLDLSWNMFSGNFPSFISNITSLIYLSLVDNYLQGSFSLNTLANHSKLEILYISSQSHKAHVETEESLWFPTFQLRSLVLGSCNLNMFKGRTTPSFLQYQKELRFLDLSHNDLVGEFPSWLIQNNSEFKYFYARGNSFVGRLQVPSIKQNLLHLDISNNKVSGLLPKDIGTILPDIKYLNLSMNNFEGNLPTSIGKMQELEWLDLSNNHFSGELPKQLGTTCIDLQHLILSNNLFHGNIPKFFHMAFLQSLFVNNNKLNCTLKELLDNLNEGLRILDISNNSISGEISGCSIVKFSSMAALLMAKNQLKGEIPSEFLNLISLFMLNLSQNKLSGSITNINLSTLVYLYLQNNSFSGPIPLTIFEGSRLVTLDLRDNNFSGNIPQWMDKMSNLQVLALGGNKFSGHIPSQLCHLQKISIMDLSHNNINGSIPFCLSNLSFGREENDPLLSKLLFGGTVALDYTTHSLINTSVSLFVPSYDFQDIVKATVDFRTKNNLYSYSGFILEKMNGIDLSCNMLTGNIPFQIGNIPKIQALNLSHNYLSGSIPDAFSNLTHIESLDLSYNHLSGEIPSQLTKLYFLEIFNVSYNNLSGMPPSTGQFANFDEDNYKGNFYLCGPRLKNKCEGPSPSQFNDTKGVDLILDMVAFYWSFAASYITILLGLITMLCINAYWRMTWFYFIAKIISKCFPNLPLY
ncbi:hypothetical protein VNO78_25669 [Psophocarpus tetragonolobus]|uniref:Leucine-rich repeat-containing N-terminal plant-type domain-containing protein n=1 Tax=Psophocarpus tetragonolobus TaxID=3891 RepID=A0AAN9S6A0_PSOTE